MLRVSFTRTAGLIAMSCSTTSRQDKLGATLTQVSELEMAMTI